MPQLKLVGVSFHSAGKIFDFNAHDFELSPGDQVIVETERGRALGTVITAPRETAEKDAPPKLKSVIRLAGDTDLQMARTNAEREQEALLFCQQRVLERNMEMKLVRAEYLFDGSKIIFYFTADGRIDFRELVRDLAQYFRTRIEMRQIGVRDEAKLVGGIGICGRELCCCSHLREFAPVSVKMAKAQGLALNPTKISGQCGRLLCCLAYEYETYNELIRNLPKCGKKLQLSSGTAEVVALDILGQKVTLAGQGGERCCLTAAQLEAEMNGKAPEKSPAAEPGKTGQKDKTTAQAQHKRPERKRGRRKPQKPEQEKKDRQQTTESVPAEGEKKKNPRRRRRPKKRPNRTKTNDKPS